MSNNEHQRLRVIQSNNRGFVFRKGDCTYTSQGPKKGEELVELPTLFIWVNITNRFLARCWTSWSGDRIGKDYVYIVTKFKDIIDLNGDTRFHLWCSSELRHYLWECNKSPINEADIPCLIQRMVHDPQRNKSTRGLLARKERIKAQTPLMNEEESALYNEIYKKSKALNSQAGYIKYHVDHIIPLAKGGLNHPSNLRIILANENQAKGIKLLSQIS